MPAGCTTLTSDEPLTQSQITTGLFIYMTVSVSLFCFAGQLERATKLGARTYESLAGVPNYWQQPMCLIGSVSVAGVGRWQTTIRRVRHVPTSCTTAVVVLGDRQRPPRESTASAEHRPHAAASRAAAGGR